MHRTYVQYLGAPSSHQYQWALDIDPNSTNLKLIIIFKAPPLLRGNSYKLKYIYVTSPGTRVLVVLKLARNKFTTAVLMPLPSIYLPVKVFAIIRATHAVTSIADVLQTFPR